MIKIKDYIFNENEIDMFSYHRDTGTLQVINTINKERLDTFITNTTFEDIEWNYGATQNATQNATQDRIKELKEDYITLEKDYGTCELENSKLRSEIKELKNRINKTIEYIGNGNLGISRKTREKFIKILKGEKNE